MSRWGKFLAWAGLMVLLAGIPLALGWGEMPDPVATHWGATGIPDSHLPKAGLPLLIVGMVAVGLLSTSLFRIEGRPTAEAVAIVGLMGGLGLSLMASVVILNSGAETWDRAANFSLPHLLAALFAASVGGWGGYLLGKRWYPLSAAEPAASSPVMHIRPGESVTWVGSSTVVWPYVLLGIAALAFLALPGWLKGFAVLFVVLAFLFSRVIVLISNDGLQIRLGGGLKVKTVRLGKIRSARPIDLEPAAWGGWGWRIIPSGTAIVLRRGDAIEITYKSGRRFAVTVDDAATGSSVLSGLVARRAEEV